MLLDYGVQKIYILLCRALVPNTFGPRPQMGWCYTPKASRPGSRRYALLYNIKRKSAEILLSALVLVFQFERVTIWYFPVPIFKGAEIYFSYFDSHRSIYEIIKQGSHIGISGH